GAGGAIFCRSRSISRSRSCGCAVGPAGGFGAAGAGVAAGGGVWGAAAGGGGGGAAGCCGWGGGGGVWCCGGCGAAPGRAGGAPCGPSFGGCVGFPSGPSSSLACATTIGADCACGGADASCMAVNAVVASRVSCRFVMCFGSWGSSEKVEREYLGRSASQRARAINKHALGRIVAGLQPKSRFICG